MTVATALRIRVHAENVYAADPSFDNKRNLDIAAELYERELARSRAPDADLGVQGSTVGLRRVQRQVSP